MSNRLPANIHFQLRLVKRCDGRKIVTYGNLAKPKEGAAKDQTLDLFPTEKSALQAARNYSLRGEKRKGHLPGNFLGVVVVSYESDPTRWRSIRPGAIGGGFQLANRPARVKGTVTWHYYVNPDGKAYHINSETHEVGDPVG